MTKTDRRLSAWARKYAGADRESLFLALQTISSRERKRTADYWKRKIDEVTAHHRAYADGSRTWEHRAMTFFAIGIEHTKTAENAGTLWRSADLFGATFVFTVGRRYKKQPSDTMQTWRRVPLFNFANLDDLYAHLPYDCMLVGVELDPRATRIEHYAHPKRCVYLLGAEDHGLTRAARERCHHLVQLPGRASMNVASAGTVVLYDRHVKHSKGADASAVGKP